MTMTAPLRPATAGQDLVWPAAVPAEQAVRKVARRLPERVPLTARLYHHPYVGLVFVCRPSAGRFPRRATRAPVVGHVVVDLVCGRAFLSDPWDEDSFTTREAALEATAATGDPDATPVPVHGPAPRITDEAAVRAGRALMVGALVRRRRLDPLGPAELHATPVHFGKPNWWVTGRRGERAVEVIVDALSGRHYACAG